MTVICMPILKTDDLLADDPDFVSNILYCSIVHPELRWWRPEIFLFTNWSFFLPISGFHTDRQSWLSFWRSRFLLLMILISSTNDHDHSWWCKMSISIYFFQKTFSLVSILIILFLFQSRCDIVNILVLDYIIRNCCVEELGLVDSFEADVHISCRWHKSFCCRLSYPQTTKVFL